MNFIDNVIRDTENLIIKMQMLKYKNFKSNVYKSFMSNICNLKFQ